MKKEIRPNDTTLLVDIKDYIESENLDILDTRELKEDYKYSG